MGPRSDGRRAVAVGICDAGTAASGHPDRAVRSVRWAVGLGTELEDIVALGASPPTARSGPAVGTRASGCPILILAAARPWAGCSAARPQQSSWRLG